MKKLTKEEKAGKERLAKYHKGITDKLIDNNIVSHMATMRDMKDAKSDYFRSVSKLWRAIRDHIADAKDCVLFDLEGTIIAHRGTGASIALNNVHLYRFRDCFDEMCLTIGVEYFCEGEESSYDPDTTSKTYRVVVPADMELNFTKRKFDAWIKKKKEERDVETEAEERAELKRLTKKYK
jgi:hypothetical protein